MRVSHLLTRREALRGLGAAGMGAVAAACGGGGSDPAATATPTTAASTATATAPAATPTSAPTLPPSGTPTAAASATPSNTVPAPTCILTPRQTEGPFYLDLNLLRSDIREDRPGTQLRLGLQLVDVAGCVPIRDALVNIWHTDSRGVYSGFPGQPGGVDATGLTFLRGYQVTDANGRVEFITIYPGWYPGRAVHIHVRVHLDATSLVSSQMYFDDALTDTVFAQAPYNTRGQRDTTNQSDFIIRSGGVQSIDDVIFDAVPEGGGYNASMVLGVAPS